MLDKYARPIIDPTLNAVGRRIAQAGLSANDVTLVGLGIGLFAAVLIAFGLTWMGLLLVIVSRIADGLDGAVARATQKTDFGGYLDIVSDFMFYGAVPFAFIVLDPTSNAIAGSFLLLSFYVNGSSFLGFAILAEMYDMDTTAQGEKSLYYSNGILEGTETIAFFILICALPHLFTPLAWLFGLACFITAGLRVYGANRIFTD